MWIAIYGILKLVVYIFCVLLGKDLGEIGTQGMIKKRIIVALI